MKKNIIASSLVIVQFTCIFLIIFRTEIHYGLNWGSIFIFASIFIGFWAMYSMKKSKFTISPVPRKESILVEDGIYQFIRHPMYLAVLLLCLAYVLQKLDIQNIIIYAILVIDLFLKLHWEESLLQEKFKEYKNYQQRTKKIIPFIF